MEFKPYQIKMKKEGDVLRYYATGERSPDAAVDFWRRIYQDCEQFKIFRIHVTVLLSGRIEPMSIPLLIRVLIELNSERPITCAWVDLNESSFNDNLVGEKLPRPDLMNIKIFDNDADAEKWLATQP